MGAGRGRGKRGVWKGGEATPVCILILFRIAYGMFCVDDGKTTVSAHNLFCLQYIL